MVVEYCHVNRMVVKGFVFFVTWIGLSWYLGNTAVTLTPQRVHVHHSHSDAAFRSKTNSVASLLEAQTSMPGGHMNTTNTAGSNAISIAAKPLPFNRSVSSTSESSIPPTSSVYPRSCADWNCSCQVISNKFCVRPGYWSNARHQEPVRIWWIRNHCETHPDFPSVICASSKVRLALEIVGMIMNTSCNTSTRVQVPWWRCTFCTCTHSLNAHVLCCSASL